MKKKNLDLFFFLVGLTLILSLFVSYPILKKNIGSHQYYKQLTKDPDDKKLKDDYHELLKRGATPKSLIVSGKPPGKFDQAVGWISLAGSICGILSPLGSAYLAFRTWRKGT